jgi:hypothetical protein
MKTTFLNLLAIVALLLPVAAPHAQENDLLKLDPKKATPEEWQRLVDFLDQQQQHSLAKTTGSMKEIRSLIIRGNKITTVVYNYGNITRPNTLPNVADLVWNRLGYGYEFDPLVAARVKSIQGDSIWMLDDGMYTPSQGAYAPDGSVKWGWLPKAGYAAPGQADIAAWSHRSDVGGDLTRKPHSWPESWYNQALGRYVWPSFLGNDATSPDEEVYFVCDDYTNAKWKDRYRPFPDDSTKLGLGLDLECRFFQQPARGRYNLPRVPGNQQESKDHRQSLFRDVWRSSCGRPQRLLRRFGLLHPPERSSRRSVPPACTKHGLRMGR